MSDLSLTAPADISPQVQPPPSVSPEQPSSGRSLFHGFESSAIMILGVLLPVGVIAAVTAQSFSQMCVMIVRHPVETIVQFALIACIPFANLCVWRRLRAKKYWKASSMGIASGLAVGAALSALVLCISAAFLPFPTHDATITDVRNGASVIYALPSGNDFLITGLVALGALCASAMITLRLRGSWETRSARMKQLSYSCIGLLLSLVTLSATEAKSVVLRLAEQCAVNGSVFEKPRALELIRQLDGERELKLDIGEPRSTGISGFYLPLAPITRRALYFAATGKPFHDARDTSVSDKSDSYLGTHVIGPVIPGLSLLRSELSGGVNARTLSSGLDWTFVFKNNSYTPQETRAEIILPPGAVVSSMTLWENGVPKEASIGATGIALAAYKWVVAGRRDPALVTDLGRGRILLQCYPVPDHDELKVRISMKAPLKLESGELATLSLPRLLKSNFEVQGDHVLRLRGRDTVSLNLRKLTASGKKDLLLSDTLSDDDVKRAPLCLYAKRDMTFGAFAARDKRTHTYAVEYVKKLKNSPPGELAVVIDGSEALGKHAGEISEALSHLPKSIPTTIVVADSDQYKDLNPIPLADGLAKMHKLQFVGGHDNLLAVLRGAEQAGEHANGAVLWIHGPQPSINREIYMTSKFVNKPSFYDLALDDDSTKVDEFFKNHQDIGPFTNIPRNGSLESDLRRLVSQWTPDGEHFDVGYMYIEKPKCPILTDRQDVQEITDLCGSAYIQRYLAANQPSVAAKIAGDYHLVSPVTSAVVLEQASDYQRFGLPEEDDDQDQLASATNGSASGGPGGNARILIGSLPMGIGNPSSNFVSRGSEHHRLKTHIAHATRRYVWNSPMAIRDRADAAGNPAVARSGRMVSSEPFRTGAVAITNSPGASTAIAAVPSLEGATNGSLGLQGAINGTIGPQGDDATYVSGLSTAGTVRVNNLANLEALLNVLANGAEIIGLIAGVGIVLDAFVSPVSMKAGETLLGSRFFKRLGLATVVIVAALAVPGVINFMVSSARDANLFE